MQQEEGKPQADSTRPWRIACSQKPCLAAHQPSYLDPHTGIVCGYSGWPHASIHHLPSERAETQPLHTHIHAFTMSLCVVFSNCLTIFNYCLQGQACILLPHVMWVGTLFESMQRCASMWWLAECIVQVNVTASRFPCRSLSANVLFAAHLPRMAQKPDVNRCIGMLFSRHMVQGSGSRESRQW